MIAPSKRRPFNPELDLEPIRELLKHYGKQNEVIDIAHLNGLASEELIEQRFNKLVAGGHLRLFHLLEERPL